MTCPEKDNALFNKEDATLISSFQEPLAEMSKDVAILVGVRDVLGWQIWALVCETNR